MIESIPQALWALLRWVVWRAEYRAGRVTKVPYMAADPTVHAQVNVQATWGRFEDAVAAVHAGDATGVGIVLGGGLAGLILTTCATPTRAS